MAGKKFSKSGSSGFILSGKVFANSGLTNVSDIHPLLFYKLIYTITRSRGEPHINFRTQCVIMLQMI